MDSRESLPSIGVQISNDVIGQIAAIATRKVVGVHGLTGGLIDGIAGLLASRGTARGVRVAVDGRDVAIDVFVAVELGVRIPEVAERVQEAVQTAVEGMTGLVVSSVNVHVQEVWLDGSESAPESIKEG